MKRNTILAIVPILIIIVVLASITVLYQQERSEYLKGEAEYQLNYRFQIENAGQVNLTSMSVRLALLKSWDLLQDVENIELSTAPNRTSTDEYDNEFVHYEFDSFDSGSFLDLNFKVNMTLNLLDYSSLIVEDPSYNENDLYRLLSTYDTLTDPTDPRILQAASNLQISDSDIMANVFEFYNFTSSYLNYRLLSTSRGASFALSNGYGDCDEYQNLFIALSQASGVPAVGHTAWLAEFEKGLTFSDEGSVAHAYPMFLLPDVGLLPVDPTRGKDSIFDNWLKTDHKRITMTRGPDHPYRLLNYRWIPDDQLGSPVIISNYTIEIQDLELNYFSKIRSTVLGSLFVFPVIFAVYNIINGIKVRKERILKLDRLLSPSLKSENTKFDNHEFDN